MGALLLYLGMVGVPLGAAHAADLEEGMAAVAAGDFATAFKIFAPLAESGDSEAQYNLAMLYRSGRGVGKDLVASARWFRRAAEQGVPEAQYYLGYLYDSGEGLEQNDHEAFVWYRKAAEQGHAQAQINLGVMYAKGLGVAQDLRLAYVWFNLAAAQGNAMAFKNKQILAQELGEEELHELRELSRQYFQKYVWPFQRSDMLHRPER